MSEASPLLSATLRRRAEGVELWLLRARRASGLPAPLFGLCCGFAVFALVTTPALLPSAAVTARSSFVASGAFFGVSIGMIFAIMPGVFAATLADLDRLRPILPAAPEDLAVLRRALVRLPARLSVSLLAISVALGAVHAWLLDQWSMPIVPAAAQTLATIALWMAMTSSLTPLIMNAGTFARLGRAAQPDLFHPERMAPFGAIALRPTLVIIGLQCAYPILVLGGDDSLAAATLLGIAASLVSMTGLFFLPLRGIRARVLARRAEQLDALGARIADLDVVRRGIEARTDPDELRELEQLLALRDRIANAPSWPLDVAGLRRVGLYVIAPPLTWAAAALVEMAIDRAL